MSGGSLNYLCYKEPPELFNHLEDLEMAEQCLLANGYKDIAADVRRLMEYIKSAENRIGVLAEQLNNVLQASKASGSKSSFSSSAVTHLYLSISPSRTLGSPSTSPR